MQDSDADLIEAATRGDLDSFGVLYERYYGRVLAIAIARLSDRHLAEDAAQETFSQAARKLSKLRDRNRFPQWLTTICRRVASRLDQKRLVHEVLVDKASEIDDPGVSAVQDKVQEALQRLPPNTREIVVLHYFGEQLSYEQIAAAQGISVQTVHGRLQRARAKLQRILQN